MIHTHACISMPFLKSVSWQVLCNMGWGVVLGPWAALRGAAAWTMGAATAVAAAARVISQASVAAWKGIRAGTRVVPAMSTTAQGVASQVRSKASSHVLLMLQDLCYAAQEQGPGRAMYSHFQLFLSTAHPKSGTWTMILNAAKHC